MARDIRKTARALQRLASSPNVHEAARARETFQAFTTRHQLSPEDLLPRTPDEWIAFFQDQQRVIEAGMAAHHQRLADILATHGVRPVVRRERRRKEKRP